MTEFEHLKMLNAHVTEPSQDELVPAFTVLQRAVGIEEANIARAKAGRKTFGRRGSTRIDKSLLKRPVLGWSFALAAGLTAVALVGAQLFGPRTPVQAAPILQQAAANAEASNEPALQPGKYMQLTRLKRVQSGIFDSDYRLKPGPKNPVKMIYLPANEDGTVTVFLPASPEGGDDPFSELSYQYQLTEVDTETAAVLDQIAQIPTSSGKDALNFIADQLDEDSDSRDAASFVRITDLLATGLVPGQTRATLYEALALIPGTVSIPNVTLPEGPTGVGIGNDEAVVDGTRTQIVIDPDEGKLLGFRTLDSGGEVTGSTAFYQDVVDAAPYLP